MQADPFPLMIYSTGTAIGETNATFIKPNDLICRLKVAANLRRAWQRFFYRKFSKTDHCVSLFRVQPEWGRRRQHQNFFTAWKCPQQLFLVSTWSFCCSVLLQHTHTVPLPCPALPAHLRALFVTHWHGFESEAMEPTFFDAWTISGYFSRTCQAVSASSLAT